MRSTALRKLRCNSFPALLLSAGMGLAPGVWAQPRFTDTAPAAGIFHEYVGGWEHFVGGGIAAFDCDGDLLPELFAAGGQAPAVLLRNRSSRGGAMRFQVQTPQALALTGVTGAYPLDLDNDGWLDLAVLRVGENQLLRGGPDCSFTRFDGVPGFADDRWSTAFSATWEPGQSLPTLAVGNYVDRTDPDGPFEACDLNFLHRPRGGTYGDPLPLDPGFCPLSMLFSDWGRFGRADLRVSNDRHYYVRGGHEQMWAMDETPRLYTQDDGWRPHMLWGMGIASRDITGDGLPEVYLSSMGDQRLQVLEPGATGPSYVDAPYARGTTAHRPYVGDDGRPSTGWHVAFGDVQNDGREDVFIAKGNVEQMPSNAIEDPNNLLIQQPGGQYVERGDAAGIANTARSRGAALVDMNLDGLLDLAVVSRRAPVQLFQNETADTGNWLLIDLRQPAPNTRAVGAWIEVEAAGTTHLREITVGGGHVSGAAVAEHFGLGMAGRARLRVIWPGGATSDWVDVGVNQVLRVSHKGGADLHIVPR